jgi:hypothetical protein
MGVHTHGKLLGINFGRSLVAQAATRGGVARAEAERLRK